MAVPDDLIAKNKQSRKKVRYPLLLILLVLTLVTSLLLHFFPHPVSKQTDDRYVNRVEQQVRSALVVMAKETGKVQQVLATNPSPTFSSLYFPSKYPYFVYRNGALVSWSDFRFVPDYNQVAGNYKVRLLQLKNGKFLSKRLVVDHQGNRTEVYSLLPLHLKYEVDNNYIQSDFNQDIFSQTNRQINREPSANSRNVRAADGTFLFSLDLPESYRPVSSVSFSLSLLAGLLSVLLLGIYVFRWIGRLIRSNHYEAGFLLMAIFLLMLRAAMLSFNLPFSLVEWDLFNPKYYASSDAFPSLGDLLLNVVLIASLAIYSIRYYARSRSYRTLISLGNHWKITVSLGLVLLSYWILYLHFYVLRTIYLHSQLTLDITRSIDFSVFKVICLLIFVINSSVYFMASHILCSVFIRLNLHRSQALLLFLAGTVGYSALFYYLDMYYPIILLLNAAYFLLLYFFRFPKYLYRFRYVTSIYFFVAALVCATIGAYAIYSLEQIKSLDDKERYAAQLLAENDVVGEYLLDEAASAITKDPFISGLMLHSLGSKALISQKIKRQFLNSYFEKYDAEVHVFNADGEHMDMSAAEGTLSVSDSTRTLIPYAAYSRRYRKLHYKTSYPNLYFLNEPGRNIIKEYVFFIDLQKNTNVIGHVIIDLKQRKEAPHDVYPELLVDRRFIQSPESRHYSYAIYHGTQLVYQSGRYNYEASMPTFLLQSPTLYAKGVEWNDYQHIGVKGKKGRLIVASSPVYPLENIFSNFSFLFLILVLIVVNFIITYALRSRKSRKNANFATKIQLYLNLAFFLPLFVVSIATLSIVDVAYRNNLSESFMKKAASVSTNLMAYLEGYEGDNDLALTYELHRIARYSESDVNLFDSTGRLNLSSQPLIYESGLLSQYINPKAYVHIIDKHEKEIMLPEWVGDLNYNSAYVGVKSKKGVLLGIISIPFFESKTELDKQLIGVTSTILNIFTAIFLFFLVLSYFASRILTVPLRLITRKIQKTSLNGYNEPLEWLSDDEIGLLVGEYNRMLVKLEASKTALSQSEKESAWREMAKQVAHEIKNPLTPMKLVLQHLQRTLRTDSPETRQHTERAFTTLLEQIDTLSDIATSFSAFAKMPIPKSEVFEITAVLNSIGELYANDEQVDLDLDIPADELFVIGDRQLMSQIFSNLIINGIQSVPVSLQPHISVSLSRKGDETVTIEVKDNGVGISESIQAKVFVPNFSTKYAGSGIGLALAKRGVEHAGGKIWFETEEGNGTSFFVELPLAKQWLAAVKAESEAKE